MLSLATELIEKISQNVEDLDDLKAFRLSCHHVNRSVEEQLYSRSQLTIHVVRQTIHHVTPLIVEMSTGMTRISKLVQNLEISTLCPEEKRKGHGPFTNIVDNEETADLTSEELKAIGSFDRRYENALRSLVSLKTLRFAIPSGDYLRAAKALLALSQLHFQDLYIYVRVCDDIPRLPLDIFPPLRQISIHTQVKSGDPIKAVFAPIAKTLARSTDLRSLSFHSTPEVALNRETRIVKPCLNEVLSEYHSLPLDHLFIRGFAIDLTESNLKIFRNTKRIHSRTWYDNEFHPGLPFALQKAGIAIQYIDVNYPDPTIFAYLGSFIGLKSLALRIYGDSESLQTILRFYERTLPLHIKFLETLSLLSVFESGWCLDYQIDAFVRCHNLRHLSLSVKFEDLLENGVEDTVDYTLFRNLLYGFREHKTIESITLYPAEGNHLRGVWHHVKHIECSRKVAEQMTKTMDALMRTDMPDPSLYNRDFHLTVKEDGTNNPVTLGWKSYFVKEVGTGSSRHWHVVNDPTVEYQYSRRRYKDFYHKTLCV